MTATPSQRPPQPARSALVIGGGVGGMRAAVDLAEAGIYTYLVESSPSLGGRVAQLGFMFPTHDCVLCRGTPDHGFGCTRPSISPTLLQHNRHPNIHVLTSTELLSCEGEAGNFQVTLEQKAQYIDPQRCINCGRCAEVCPAERPSAFQLGMSTRKAVDKSAPRSIPDAYYLDLKLEQCDTCRKCVEVCPTGAIDLHAQPRQLSIHVGAVILALGFTPFDPSKMAELGYGRIPNVITSMQYERLASRSGPTEGIVRRISDGAIPRRIAWLQCIGSRDQQNAYCSSICCMYATKEAILAKERIPGVECHIFTMDERAFNKEYNQYYMQSREKYGIQYTRCRISSLEENPRSGEVILRYPSGRRHDESAPGQGPLKEERFDMVVLAVGIRPPRSAVQMARKLGIELNSHGFCETDKFAPLATSRPGIFVCGAFSSPKEIAETILDASGAAAEAMRILRPHIGGRTFSRGAPFISAQPLPAEAGSTGPLDGKIQVVLCECLGEISKVVNLAQLEAYAQRMPGVLSVLRIPAACLPEGQEALREALASAEPARLVVGACSHRTHEPLFQRLAAEAGINPYLMEMVNLREHCAWVHADDPAGATQLAAELLRIGVERAALAQPITKTERRPQASALVLGGGPAGMTAALAIADAGYPVHLVERSGELGGNLRHVYYVAEGDNPQRLLRDLVNRVVAHERIRLHLSSELLRHTGSVGDFRSLVRTPNGEQEIRHGVTIIATGAQEGGSSHYHMGEDPRILPQSKLEDILAHQPERISQMRSVVMIQCVPPERSSKLDYCSRICCTNTLKNALRIKMLNPACQVVILYKNIITYGFREQFYLEARRRGVLFVRYTDDQPPQVHLVPHGAHRDLVVSVPEHIFGRELRFEPDLLALSTAIQPAQGTRGLAQMLGLPLSPEGFLLEAHLKMRPMDFADEGIFLAGMAHYPKFIEETLTHALATAGRAITVLSRPQLQLGGVVAEVTAERCTGCLTCVRTCPFGIPEMRADIPGVAGLGGSAWIDPARCQGCGTCTAECPAKAIQLRHYSDEQITLGLGAWKTELVSTLPAQAPLGQGTKDLSPP